MAEGCAQSSGAPAFTHPAGAVVPPVEKPHPHGGGDRSVVVPVWGRGG